jgi:hypothetical protein
MKAFAHTHRHIAGIPTYPLNNPVHSPSHRFCQQIQTYSGKIPVKHWASAGPGLLSIILMFIIIPQDNWNKEIESNPTYLANILGYCQQELLIVPQSSLIDNIRSPLP